MKNEMDDLIKLNEFKSTLKEAGNLRRLYEEGLNGISEMISSHRGRFTNWDLRHVVSGYYYGSPGTRWLGREITIKTKPELGSGIVVAIKKVGNFYIPGVEFDKLVDGGHACRERDGGILGADGHCLWLWLNQLSIIQNMDDSGPGDDNRG